MKLVPAMLPADVADLVDSQIPLIQRIAQSEDPDERAQAYRAWQEWAATLNAQFRGNDPRRMPPAAAQSATAPSAPSAGGRPCQGCGEKARETPQRTQMAGGPSPAARAGGKFGHAVAVVVQAIGAIARGADDVGPG